MGAVKAFGLWLAESVYYDNLSDEEIMMALAKRYPDIRKDGLDSWLLEQIRVVRENPHFYREMVDIK